jgi:hypothetical protein
MSVKEKKHCEPPFWRDLSVLFREFSLQYKPTCEHTKWNFLARIVILSLFIGIIASIFVASVVSGLPILHIMVLFGVLSASAIILFTPSVPMIPSHHPQDHPQDHHSPSGTPIDDYHALPYTATVQGRHTVTDSHQAPHTGYEAPIKEHFVNGGSMPGSAQPVDESPMGHIEVDAHPYSGPSLPDYTPPTSRNLFMNILVDEMKYNPDRPAAAPVDNAMVKQTMDDFFRVQWFSDPTDVFGKNQGQRQFITQPSTTVPNDQGSFADWLYKIPGKTCKEGGRGACVSTTGNHVPWLSDSVID